MIQVRAVPVGRTRNASVAVITLSQLERQFNDDCSLCSLLTALVDYKFNGPMSNSEQTCEQY
jgi:hypothetical protein